MPDSKAQLRLARKVIAGKAVYSDMSMKAAKEIAGGAKKGKPLPARTGKKRGPKIGFAEMQMPKRGFGR